MNEALCGSAYFFVTLTLAAYAFGEWVRKKLRFPLFNPILVAAALIILVLKALDIPNSAYQAGCEAMQFLLTPATICLAIAFFQQLDRLKKHLGAISLGVLAGTIASLGSVWLLGKLLGLDRVLTLSLLPKSITTAIGVALSQELGGIAAITTAVIILTGILGNVAGPALCKLFRLNSPIAQGVAFGTASHVVGTTKATEIGELCGAVSSFSLTLAGIFTCVFLSFLAQFM